MYIIISRSLHVYFTTFDMILKYILQWRSEGNWRPGANLNFAPPPPQKFLKNDTEMSSIQLIMCIIISTWPTCIF